MESALVARNSGRAETFAGQSHTSGKSPGERVRLLIGYRHTLLRQALRLLLSQEEGFEVLEESDNGKDIVEKAEKLQPDVVLMDSALSIIDGVEATRMIKKKSERVKVLLLALSADDDYIVRLLRAGASGCLLKDADATELKLAVQAAYRGGSYLSPSISERIVHNYVRLKAGEDDRPEPEKNILSVREREVLQLVADGFTNREIAEKLFISVKTVEAHKTHIGQKLNIKGRAGLIKYAIRTGLIDLEPVSA